MARDVVFVAALVALSLGALGLVSHALLLWPAFCTDAPRQCPEPQLLANASAPAATTTPAATNTTPAAATPPPAAARAADRRVLLIGDSGDRFIVTDTCAALGGAVIDWSNGVLWYDITLGANACHTPLGLIGHLHTFGSKATGAYEAVVPVSVDDAYTDTQPRIRKGLEMFTEAFGRPDAVVFQILFWDLEWIKKAGLRPGADAAADYTSTFRANMAGRVADILASKHPDTALLIRTVPWCAEFGALTGQFNDVLRELAAEHGLPLLDFDRDLWGWREHTEDNERPVFRDSHHPAAQYCARFGLELLRRVQAGDY